MGARGTSSKRAFAERRERHALEEALKHEGIDVPVHYDETTVSTNTTALDMAARGEPEWTVVAAGHQTGGRGRLGRTWVSQPDASLLFSFLLRPPLPPDRALLLTLLSAVAMAEAAEAEAGVNVGCKWPNDLLLESRKVAGILAEARVRGRSLQHVVIGLGVNLRGVPDGVEYAASLGPIDRRALLAGFLRRFRERYTPGGDGFAQLVVSAYAPRCQTLGRRVCATTLSGRVVEGQAVDLDLSGNLVVETKVRREVVGFGEIQHLR
jgi:BirA family transcriptional regulator, biotin operon repressor / biotin---[acetyl-CoA-carboxylase] ligase